MVEHKHISFISPLSTVGCIKKEAKAAVVFVFTFLTILAILVHLYPAAAVAFLGGLVLIQDPQEKHKSKIRLDKDGISIGRKRFSYDDFKTFWIHIGDQPVLYLEPAKRYLFHTALVITDYKPIEIRDFLRHHLPERLHPSEKRARFYNSLFGLE